MQALLGGERASVSEGRTCKRSANVQAFARSSQHASAKDLWVRRQQLRPRSWLVSLFFYASTIMAASTNRGRLILFRKDFFMQASCRYESSSGTIYVQTRRSGPWNDGAVIPDQHSDQTRPARGEIYVRRFAHEKRVVLLREREVSISCFQAFCDWFSEFVLIKFMLELRFVLSWSIIIH